MSRVISIFSLKGGVGKTSLSFSLSKDLEMGYITNDMSIAIQKHKKSKYVRNKVPLRDNTIYDFGGFSDNNANEIIKVSDLLIIPTINDQNSILKTLEVIKKFSQYVEILVVGTMVENDKDKKNIRKFIAQKYPDINIICLKKTRAFKNGMEEGLSLKDLFNSSPLNKHRYKGIYKNYVKFVTEVNHYI